MTSAESSLVIVDTTVLLAASDRSRSSHEAATELLSSDARRLALTPQIVREYLAVATRPADANGLGMSGNTAAGNVGQLLAEMPLLSENIVAARTLVDFVAHERAVGKNVHDANIVAVALAHHAATIVTDNVRHFARFADVIAIEDLVMSR